MKILVIIPVFNESKHIVKCLHSLHKQIYKNIQWILVNDSSTDNSREIIEEFIQDKPSFNLINLVNKSEHIPGAKVIKTFYEGLNSVDWKQYDILVKLDADIILPRNYFELIVHELKNNPKIGIIGGLVYIKKGTQWMYENISNKNHVRGPIKTYRKECFIDIGGLRMMLGWDNLDILLAHMHNWEVKVIKNLFVKHLKPTAQIYQESKSQKLGEYFYNIGLSKKLALISCAKASWKDKSLQHFLISFKTFLAFERKKKERIISQQEIDFIRKIRWNEIINRFKW
ncbi:MAG: glycosyltransferase family 2 protein [Apibacter sp.]|nr:glycosyltransferase family 2 protein [Apibacter sp.]